MKKRSWVIASAFVWCLAGAVAIATYSGQPPQTSAPPEHDHASHAGQPHVDEPSVDAATPPASSMDSSTNAASTNAATASPNESKVPALTESGQKSDRIVPREIQWEDSFENAMQQARAQNKPILIDFYADWCGPCKMMDERTYPDRQVIAQSQNWITVKVNGEKRPDVMQAYGLNAYPTIVFAHGNGQPVKIVSAYMDAPQLVQSMQEAFSTWNSTQDRA